LYSKTLIGLFAPALTSYLTMLDMTTRLAGKLTPAASVGVDAKSLMLPFLNSVSTISRQFWFNPA